MTIAGDVVIHQPDPADFHLAIHDADHAPILKLWPASGRVWMADGWGTDAAARQFWAALRELADARMPS